MELFGGRFDLPIDFTYSLLAAFSSLISFATVRLHVRFSYHFYMLRRNSGSFFAKNKTSPERQKYINLMRLMFLNFIAPLFVTLFYIKPIFETLVVPEYLSESTWRILRVLCIAFAVCLRLMTFREEMQFIFNESYLLVQRLMFDKQEKLFRYVKLRI